MRPFLSSLLFIGFISMAVHPACVRAEPDLAVPEGIFGAPRELIRAWLRFHETELCQDIDAVFVFGNDGMEVWSRVEDEKQYRSFEKMLEPLLDRYRIELYATYPPEDKESDSNWDPPSSLWENSQLRSSLGDPFSRNRDPLGFEIMSSQAFNPAHEMLKQRLLVYADQVKDRNLKIKRYSEDLPALSRMAVNPLIPSDIRLGARLICQAHVRKLEKEFERLNKSLKYAFPKTEQKEETPLKQPQYGSAEAAFAGLTGEIAATALNITRRVDQFIHPTEHTVDLDELRRPSMLSEILRVQEMIAAFLIMPAKLSLDGK
jgi:hypothetical protein